MKPLEFGKVKSLKLVTRSDKVCNNLYLEISCEGHICGQYETCAIKNNTKTCVCADGYERGTKACEGIIGLIDNRHYHKFWCLWTNKK